MSRDCGVERHEAGLRRLIGLIDRLRQAHGEADALIAARFIAAGALERTESRGGHFRTDHPARHASAEHTVLRLADLDSAPSRPARYREPAE